jgi:hypothetical protein
MLRIVDLLLDAGPPVYKPHFPAVCRPVVVAGRQHGQTKKKRREAKRKEVLISDDGWL